MLMWIIIIGVIWFSILCLTVLFHRLWLNKIMNNAVGVFGTMGKGKDAFMVGAVRAIQKKRGKVYSNIPIQLSTADDMSYLLKPEYLELNKKYSQFPFRENDIVYVSEAGIEFPSDDYKNMGANKIGVAMYIKFIRHLHSGTFIYNEQDPNRVWIQIREKTHSFIKIERLKKGLIFPFLTFTISVYTSLDDYGIVIPSKSDVKKGRAMPPSLKGEVVRRKVRFFKSSIFGKYDTRAFSFLGDIKRNVYENVSGKDSLDEIIKFDSMTLDDSNLKYLNLDKFADIVNSYEDNKKNVVLDPVIDENIVDDIDIELPVDSDSGNNQ